MKAEARRRRGITFFVLGTQPNGGVGATTDHRNGTYSATYVGARIGTDTIVALIEGTRVLQTLTVSIEP